MMIKLTSSCQILAHVFVPLVLLLSAAGYGHAQPGAMARGGPAVAVYNLHFQSLLAGAVRDGLPGVSLRVAGPVIDFKGAAGVANLASGEALTTRHALYAASLGKTFAVVIALQLCAEGKLELDKPITAWLDAEHAARIPSSGEITLRHLLSHTSGLTGFMNDEEAWRSDFVRAPHRQWSHREILAYIHDKPLLFEPGTGYHYSNSNYILAGLLIEQVSGRPLHALIRQRILAPLGLRDTVSGAETTGNGKIAHGYFKRRGRVIDSYPWYSHYGLANAGIHSTPSDLARFIETLFTTDMLLSERWRAEMTRVSGLGDPPSNYGMGLMVHTNGVDTGHWYANHGIDPGYHADMMYFPEMELTVAVAANASLGRLDDVYERLVSAVLRTARDAVRVQRVRARIRKGAGYIY